MSNLIFYTNRHSIPCVNHVYLYPAIHTLIIIYGNFAQYESNDDDDVELNALA